MDQSDMDKQCFCLVLILALSSLVASEILTFDLHRQRSAHHNQLILDEVKGGGGRGLRVDWPSHDGLGAGKNVTNQTTIALYRYLDNEFYGKINVGNRNGIFNVIVDTAWRTSWIISVNCPSTNIGCWFKNKYDHTKSKSYVPDGEKFEINEGTYKLSGTYSYDNMTIGGKEVKKQRFVEMESVPNSFIFTKSDGILGLSPSSDDKTFLDNLLAQGAIKKAMFAMYLSRDRQSSRGGSIMIGFYDKKFIHKTNKQFDEITYVDVINSDYWEFKMDSVILTIAKNDTYICSKDCFAIIDSSGTSIYAPFEYIQEINKLIGARKTFYGKYEVDCDTINKLPKINFVLNGKNFTLSGKEYVQKVSLKAIQICISAFTGPSTPVENSKWLIGGAFLAEYYSIYDLDKKQIGFVKAA